MRFHRVLEKYSAPTTPRIDTRGSRREIDRRAESEIVPFGQLRPTSSTKVEFFKSLEGKEEKKKKRNVKEKFSFFNTTRQCRVDRIKRNWTMSRSIVTHSCASFTKKWETEHKIKLMDLLYRRGKNIIISGFYFFIQANYNNLFPSYFYFSRDFSITLFQNLTNSTSDASFNPIKMFWASQNYSSFTISESWFFQNFKIR